MERQSLEPRIGCRDKASNQGYDVETKLGTKDRMERQSLVLRLRLRDKTIELGLARVR